MLPIARSDALAGVRSSRIYRNLAKSDVDQPSPPGAAAEGGTARSNLAPATRKRRRLRTERQRSAHIARWSSACLRCAEGESCNTAPGASSGAASLAGSEAETKAVIRLRSELLKLVGKRVEECLRSGPALGKSQRQPGRGLRGMSPSKADWFSIALIKRGSGSNPVLFQSETPCLPVRPKVANPRLTGRTLPAGCVCR